MTPLRKQDVVDCHHHQHRHYHHLLPDPSLQNPRCSGGGVGGAVAASFTAVSPCSAHHAPYLPPVDRAAVGVRNAPLATHQPWTCGQSSPR